MSNFKFHAALLGLTSGVMLLSASPVVAATCEQLTLKTTPKTQAADAALIKKHSKELVSVQGVGKVLQQGDWRLVWATPDDAERGVFFFKKDAKKAYKLIDTWGGVFGEDNKSEGIDWASNLKGGKPPAKLVECFVNAIIDEE